MKTFSKLKDIFLKTLAILWQCREGHLKGFEMIVDDPGVIKEIQNRKMAKQYIFPFLLPLYLSLDSLYHLFTVGYNPNQDNPVLFHHKIASPLPVLFRKQADAVYLAAYPFSIISYYCLIFEPMKHVKLCLYPSTTKPKVLCSIDGMKIGRKLSFELLKFRTKISQKVESYFKFFELECHLGSTFMFLFYELYRIFFVREYQTEFRNWLTIILFLLYIHQFIFLMRIGFSFTIVNLQIHIKQHFYLQTIKFETYCDYLKMLKMMLKHTKEIDAWNGCYVRYISSIIGFNCFISCVSLSCLQDSKDIPLIIKTEWIFFVLFFLAFILMLTAVSSKTIQLNKVIFFRLRSLQTTICDLRIIRYHRRIVHLDLINEYKVLLIRSCFRFVNSSPLCNKFGIFNIFGFLMFVYMKVYQHR